VRLTLDEGAVHAKAKPLVVAKRIGVRKARYRRTSVSGSPAGAYHEQSGRRSGSRSPMA
jgi:hypothetical protein